MGKSPVVTAVLAAAIGVASVAFAATGPAVAPPSSSPTPAGQPTMHAHHRMHHMHRMHHLRMLDQLDLTAAQRSTIQQAIRSNRQQLRPTMQALRQQRRAFADATPGSAGYQGAVTALASAEANAAREGVEHEATLRTRIYNVLTPQQRTKFASLRAERRAKMQKWRQERSQRHANPAPASSSGQ